MDYPATRILVQQQMRFKQHMTWIMVDGSTWFAYEETRIPIARLSTRGYIDEFCIGARCKYDGYISIFPRKI